MSNHVWPPDRLSGPGEARQALLRAQQCRKQAATERDLGHADSARAYDATSNAWESALLAWLERLCKPVKRDSD